MCRHQRRRQKHGHILDDGARLFLVQRRHDLQRELGGDFALGVPAHAVGQHKKAGLAGVAVAHAIFVFFAPAFATDLKDRKLHFVLAPKIVTLRRFFLVSVITLSNCSRTFSPTVSLV